MFLTFNGATAFRPWKRLCLVDGDLWIVGLQWSHSLSAMETRPVRPICDHWGHRLQWSHSLSAMETTLPPAHRCYPFFPFNGATAFRPWKHRWRPARRWAISTFNGATAFRPWKLPKGHIGSVLFQNLQWSHSLSAMETGYTQEIASPGIHPPSMEPQPFGHGNTPTAKGCHRRAPFLQWSHSLSAMETAGLPQGIHLRGVPSMEPQPFGHGNKSATVMLTNVHVSTILPLSRPSMEPQPFGHGNGANWEGMLAEISLQWSHSLSAMETVLCLTRFGGLAFLQWSHSLSAMETAIGGLIPDLSKENLRHPGLLSSETGLVVECPNLYLPVHSWQSARGAI